MIWTIIVALVVGLIIGAIARWIVPGKQNMSIWLTMAVGAIAALLGTWIAGMLAVGAILTFVIQLVLAVVGVYLVAGATRTRRHA